MLVIVHLGIVLIRKSNPSISVPLRRITQYTGAQTAPLSDLLDGREIPHVSECKQRADHGLVNAWPPDLSWITGAQR